MTDVASIGVETHVTNGDQATRQLDAFGKATENAENKARGAASATSTYNKMLVDLLSSIDRSLMSMTAISKEQAKISDTALRAAEAKIRLARAAEMEATALKQAAVAASQVNNELAKTPKIIQPVVNHFDTMYDDFQKDFVGQYVAGMNRVDQVHKKADKSGKYLTQTTLNLSRQFADIAVTGAMGMNPLMILIQQVPQIADAFATAKTQGLGFSAVMKGMGGMIAPVLPLILGIGAAIGVLVGAFALFEGAVDKQTKRATTWGDTWKATVHVIGAAIMSGPIGDAIKWLGETWDGLMNNLVTGTMGWLDRMVGFWGAAIQTIVKNWRHPLQALSAITVGAVNNIITTIEGLVNASIKGMNRITSLAGWKPLGEVVLPRIKQANNAVAEDFEKAQKRIAENFKAGREKMFGAIVKEADRLAGLREKNKKGAEHEAKAQKIVNQAAIDGGKAYAELTEQVLRYFAAMNDKMRDLGMTSLQKVQRDLREGLALIAKWEDGAVSIVGVEARRNSEILEKWAEAQQMVNVKLERTPEDLAQATKGLKDMNSQWERALELTRDVSDSVSDLFNSIKNRDWAFALKSFMEVFNKLKSAFNGGSKMDKISAVGGVGYAVGQAVGGRAGKVISGGASGAVAGAQIGSFAGPTGTIIGAVVGGIAGALSGFLGKSKKQKEREAAAQRALEHAAEIAAQKLEMEADLLLLQGKATEALAKAREIEMNAMDLSLRHIQEQINIEKDAAVLRNYNAQVLKALGKDEEALALERQEELRGIRDIHKPLQLSIWALEDLKVAADKLETQASETARIQGDIYTAMGNSAGALALARERELAAMDASLQPLQRSAWALQDAQQAVEQARGDLERALQAEMSALDETISKFDQFAKSLERFNNKLKFDPANNNLSPTPQYDQTRKEFERLIALPPGDLERLEKLEEVGDRFLDASRANSRTGLDYNRDLQAVRRATEASKAAAESQVSQAQAQLNALNAIAASNGLINNSVLSVGNAVTQLGVAQATYAQAQITATETLGAALVAQGQAQAELSAQITAAQNTANAALTAANNPANTPANTPRIFNPTSYLANNPDVQAEFNRHTSTSDIAYLGSLGIYNAEGYAAWHYQNYGMGEGRTFARGGAFSNGIVQRPTSFNMGLMGEAGPEAVMPLTNINGVLGVRAANDDSAASSMSQLQDSLSGAMSLLRSIERSLVKMEFHMDTWDKVGLHVRGEAPGEAVATKEAA